MVEVGAKQAVEVVWRGRKEGEGKRESYQIEGYEVVTNMLHILFD